MNVKKNRKVIIILLSQCSTKMHITYIFFDGPDLDVIRRMTPKETTRPGVYVITDGRNVCGIGYEGASSVKPEKIMTVLAKELFNAVIEVQTVDKII
jgi:hypothetical protein